MNLKGDSSKHAKIVQETNNSGFNSATRTFLKSTSINYRVFQLSEAGFAFLELVQIILTRLNIVGVELQALDEVVVLHLALVLLHLLLGGLSLSLSLSLVSNLLAVSVSAHNASDGLVGDFTSGAEGHSLENGSHQTAHEASSLLGLRRGLRGSLTRRGGRGGVSRGVV